MPDPKFVKRKTFREKPPRVVIADQIAQRGVEVLRQAGLTVTYEPAVAAEDLPELLRGAEALIVRSRTQVTAELLEQSEGLQVVGRAGTGVDNIAVEAATKKGVVVMNTPGSNTISAAEHTMAMILSLTRNIPQANQAMKEGKWPKKAYTGFELYEKKIGVLGLGRIGREVAKRLKAFGAYVLAYDPYISERVAEDLGVVLCTVEAVLKQADLLTLHMPLTEETAHFLNREKLALCKQGVKVVNCARGELIDEQALYEALRSGQVSAAGLDVFEQEPPKGSPLVELPQVITTPHLAASTVEAQERVGVEIAQQVADFLLRGVILNAVNFPSLSVEEYHRLFPYLRLAEALGSFASQICSFPIQEVGVRYYGELTHLPTKPISAAAILGVLKVFLRESVNIVNARVMAKERGIKVVETQSSRLRSYAHVISLQLRGEGTEWIEGTVHPSETKDAPDMRIVSIDGIQIEAPLSPHMLFLRNKDVPGVIGMVGSTLGAAGANIANFALGREGPLKKALAIISLDDPCPAETVAALGGLDPVTFVKAVRLTL